MSKSKSPTSSPYGYALPASRARTVRAVLAGLILGVVGGLLAFGCGVAS